MSGDFLPYMEMLKATHQVTCMMLSEDEYAVANRYWRTNQVGEDGSVLYYHDDLHWEAVPA